MQVYQLISYYCKDHSPLGKFWNCGKWAVGSITFGQETSRQKEHSGHDCKSEEIVIFQRKKRSYKKYFYIFSANLDKNWNIILAR